ncbi:hypothetical protein TNCV_5011671 [Trichonephila clavipes]|nr:hypothetical protein TNCV_5011671 [Trichonephila clavipes]
MAHVCRYSIPKTSTSYNVVPEPQQILRASQSFYPVDVQYHQDSTPQSSSRVRDHNLSGITTTRESCIIDSKSICT